MAEKKLSLPEKKKRYTRIKNTLREKFNTVAASDVEVLIRSKEDVINSIVEIVKKEIEDRYGEERKETIKGIAETKTL